MPIKRWILQKMNRMNGGVVRPVAREPALGRAVAAGGVASRGSPHGLYDAREGGGLRPEQLGPYAPLVTAIRDELQHFATTQLRLHLAIAERDRYLLTSIDVECVDGSEGADLLRHFMREFTPEQVKRFLARGVIGQLPNASAIDLSQFEGLNGQRDADETASVDDVYAELIAQLKSETPSDGPRSFDVRLQGRWMEADGSAARAPVAPAVPAGSVAAVPGTPLAGAPLEIEIEDADGTRVVKLGAVVPQRRYAIGKDDGCDVRVDGAFASRRHCEIWMDNGTWWAADAASTNGIRVESDDGVIARAGGLERPGQPRAPLAIAPGARLVLSALASGRTSDYPSLRLRLAAVAPAVATPLAPSASASGATPVTPISASPVGTGRLAVTVTMSSGITTVPLAEASLPLRIGRSRNQDLVVDWAHAGVSGRHLEIAHFDASGADVEVHGDNGVVVDGVEHKAGRCFRWRCGETMTLGRAGTDEPSCTLRLSRPAPDTAA